MQLVKAGQCDGVPGFTLNFCFEFVRLYVVSVCAQTHLNRRQETPHDARSSAKMIYLRPCQSSPDVVSYRDHLSQTEG